MKKRMLAICLGLMITAAALGGSGLTVQASENGEMKSRTLQAELLQEGYFANVGITAEEEIEALAGDTAWSTLLKQRLTEAIRNYKTKIYVSDLGIAATEENAQILVKVFEEIVNSNPDFFYMGSSFEYTYYQGGNVVDILFCYNPDYTDKQGNVDTEKMEVYFDAKERALEVVQEDMTDVEKLLALHDYLVLNCTYDVENYEKDTVPAVSYTAYGALVDGTAVCSGYAAAYASLLQSCDIDCYILGSDKMDHAWNLVYVDGAWQHIDATWDDPVFDYTNDYNGEGYVSHAFFLKSDEEMQAEGYKEWFEEGTGGNVPKATKSDTYSDAIFRVEEQNPNTEQFVLPSFTYDDGYWYYISYNKEKDSDKEVGYITRSRLDGSQKNIWADEGECLFVQMMDDVLYYADYDGIYVAKPAEDLKPEKIMTMVGSKDYREYLLTEFAVYGDGVIGAELYEPFSGVYKRVTADSDDREKGAAPTLVITKSPTVNYFEQNAKVLLDGSYGLKYADGKVLSINPAGLKAVVDNMEKEGLYDVQLNWWRGLTAEYQVSVKYDFPISDVLVSDKNWQYNGIKYVVDKGYMVGSDNRFNPNIELSRCMLVQILYAMEGKPEVVYEQKFSDVSEEQWYAKAVTWAYKSGITSGYANGKFGVNDSITREQTALMLKKYAELKGIDTTASADLSSYKDTEAISSWAEAAISWANYNGIISGKGSGEDKILDPVGNASRAEMAAMITKFCENIIAAEDDAEDKDDENTEEKPEDGSGDTTEGEDGDKSETENGDTTEGEDGDKSETENGDTTEGEGGDKSETENGDTTEGEEGDKSENENGDTTEGEDEDKSETENGDTTEGEDGDKSETESGDTTEGEDGDKSETESGDTTEGEAGDKSENENGDTTEEEAGDKSETESGDTTEGEDGDKSEAESGDTAEGEATDSESMNNGGSESNNAKDETV